jgi:hypothetical protein
MCGSVLRTTVSLGVGILVLVAIACGSTDSAATDVESDSASYDGPIFRDSMKELAIRAAGRNRELLNATIQQNGRDVFLALTIDCSESEEKANKTARFLGEELLRMIKQFGPDSDPDSSVIGTGDFDYLVGVSCADGTTIAKWVKAQDNAEIVW